MIYQFKIFSTYKESLACGTTLRSMGSFERKDPKFLRNVEQLGLGEPVLAEQTHSDVIFKVDHLPETEPEGDAFVTRTKNLLLGAKSADCQGVVIFDPIREAVGVVHSGWKGSTQNIIGKTIQRMKKAFGSKGKDLLVGISPSLGPCCSEFSDPEEELPAFCHPYILDNKHVDFWSLSKKQCADEGMLESNVEVAGICTKCDPNYFSYRLGDDQRMMTFAKLI